MVGGFGGSRDLVFSPSRSNLGLVSSRLAGFVRDREIHNLGMVSGPVLLKIKGKCWVFIFLGSTKRKTTETNDDIGQSLVSGALDRTKKSRKTAADIFAKSGPEKPYTNLNESTNSLDLSPRGFSPKRAESTYKRVGSI